VRDIAGKGGEEVGGQHEHRALLIQHVLQVVVVVMVGGGGGCGGGGGGRGAGAEEGRGDREGAVDCADLSQHVAEVFAQGEVAAGQGLESGDAVEVVREVELRGVGVREERG
jgi:hypothetical protein